MVNECLCSYLDRKSKSPGPYRKAGQSLSVTMASCAFSASMADPQSIDPSYPAEPPFKSDSEALAYVNRQALLGSELHCKALRASRHCL